MFKFLESKNKRCGPYDYSLCLLTLDSQTGALQSAVYTNYTVYKFSHVYEGNKTSSNKVLSFVEGLTDRCKTPEYNISHSFATVDLDTAEATFISCMDKDIVMDQWISSFSNDETEFVTSSGNAESGEAQFLVVNVATGKKIKDLFINNLGKTLGSVSGLFQVFAVDYID